MFLAVGCLDNSVRVLSLDSSNVLAQLVRPCRTRPSIIDPTCSTGFLASP